MTIPYTIQIGKNLNNEESTTVEKIILSTFAEIHSLYNNWNPHSEISKLNALPAWQKGEISPKLGDFLKKVDQCVCKSEGLFDPTVYPLLQLWKNSLTNGHLPQTCELSKVAECVGWKKIHFEEGFFWKENEQTMIDLCGVAKGYGVDLLIEKLVEAGFSSIYVEWGGEIRVEGLHPENRPWKIKIQGGETLSLKGGAIATSGSYMQNWQINGNTYTHIIDPISQSPIINSPISSATLIAPTCLEADAMATALMVIQSKKRAEDWAAKQGFKVYLW